MPGPGSRELSAHKRKRKRERGVLLAPLFAPPTGTPHRGGPAAMPSTTSAGHEQRFLTEQTHFGARFLRVNPVALRHIAPALTTKKPVCTTVSHKKPHRCNGPSPPIG